MSEFSPNYTLLSSFSVTQPEFLKVRYYLFLTCSWLHTSNCILIWSAFCTEYQMRITSLTGLGVKQQKEENVLLCTKYYGKLILTSVSGLVWLFQWRDQMQVVLDLGPQWSPQISVVVKRDICSARFAPFYDLPFHRCEVNHCGC